MLAALVLTFGILIELLRAVLRRRGAGRGMPWRLAVWFFRPWMAWAALSVVVRANPERGFNNLRTFPFFANLWREDEIGLAALPRLAALPTVWLWGGLAVLLAGGLAALAWRAACHDASPRERVLVLTGAYALTVSLQLAIACLPEGAGDGERPGSLLSCWHAHATMLYAVPHVKSTSHFLQHFIEHQPDLRRTIHALSHPPGAALSMYWLGRAAGAGGQDVRADSTRLRYAIALPLFSGLGIFVLYALASRLFDSRRVGLTAALLWAASPAVLVYNTFAQDGVYAVFFVLALLLIWIVVTQPRRAPLPMAALGVVFFALVMLNYSWCLMTTIFACFGAWEGRRRGWVWRDWLWRTLAPLALMTVLVAALLATHRLNYWIMYQYASEYVNEWYNFEDAYQWLLALVGGQFDIWLMMGAVTTSAFLLSWRRAPTDAPRARGGARALLVIVLAAYALPILFGPSCLKMETARCWNWVTAIPFAFAAWRLLRAERPGFMVGGAVLTGALTYLGMRLFMNFAP